MARWVLTCKRCGAIHNYSRISDTLADYFIPVKPDIPPEGVECECPDCKAKIIYQKHELTFQFAKKSGV